jgi:hypothetical protein
MQRSRRCSVLERRSSDFETFASIDADKEIAMKKLPVTGLAFAIATGFALPLASPAEAAMSGALPSTQVLPIEQAQFFFLGHNFCWYDDGWQGPGWYWCNYAWRSGYGWGGGDGWHGWNRGQWRGNRGPVGHPTYAPQNKVVRTPQYHAPQNNVVRTPQFHSSAAPHVGGHGPAPSHGGGGGGVYDQKNK